VNKCQSVAETKQAKKDLADLRDARDRAKGEQFVEWSEAKKSLGLADKPRRKSKGAKAA
jgi:hypothetical protein